MHPELLKRHQPQRMTTDCGLAAVAMLLDKPYEEVKQSFCELGLHKKRGGKPPYATNFKELSAVLALWGKEPVIQRFKSYEALPSHAILKVNQDKKGDWHWVTFLRINELPIILDPAIKIAFLADYAKSLDYQKLMPLALASMLLTPSGSFLSCK